MIPDPLCDPPQLSHIIVPSRYHVRTGLHMDPKLVGALDGVQHLVHMGRAANLLIERVLQTLDVRAKHI